MTTRCMKLSVLRCKNTEYGEKKQYVPNYRVCDGYYHCDDFSDEDPDVCARYNVSVKNPRKYIRWEWLMWVLIHIVFNFKMLQHIKLYQILWRYNLKYRTCVWHVKLKMILQRKDSLPFALFVVFELICYSEWSDFIVCHVVDDYSFI